MKKLVPISHTSLSLWQTCPLWFKLKYVDKSLPPEEENEAMRFGNRMHKALELALQKNHELPIEFKYLSDYVESIRDLGAYPATMLIESGFALDAEDEPCLYTEWDRKWLHAKLDVVVVKENAAVVIDHKSGQVKDNPQQLAIAAMLLLQTYPVERVTTCFVFTQHNDIKKDTYIRGNAATEHAFQQLRQEFARYKAAQENEMYPPNPSGLCRGWCPNKLCQFWKPKRGEME